MPFGNEEIKFNNTTNNNDLYISTRATSSFILEQPIVLSSKVPENADLGNIRRYDDWLVDLSYCESGGREDIVILDTNNQYSYSCLQFQERTFNYYSKRYGFENVDIINCEHQKDVANEMLKENYNNWRHWYQCSTEKIGLPY